MTAKRGGQVQDKVGMVFDRLTVLTRAPSRANLTYWKCLCECGNEVEVATSSLRPGRTRSCGCLNREISSLAHWEGCGDVSGEYWGKLRHGAHERGYDFAISIEFAWSLYQEQSGLCALTGWPLSLGSGLSGKVRRAAVTASLDRVDNTIGYVEGNVWWLHKDINRLKNNYSLEYFREMCRAVAKP